MASLPSSDLVSRKLEAWKGALIDLSRRNPLLTRSPKARNIVKVPAPTQGTRKLTFVRHVPDLFDAANPVPPPAKPGEVRLSEADFKALNSLRLKATLAEREQGVSILFVARGVLEWPDPDSTKKEPLRSPLLLVPVALERLPGGDAFHLKRSEDEVTVNPTLVHRLGLPDVRFTLPDFDGEADDGQDHFLRGMTDTVAAKRGWKVLPECYLGAFFYLKMVIYQDLEAQAERAKAHPVVAALAGDSAAIRRLPAVALPEPDALDEVTSSEPCFSVLNADPSQQRAILAAKRGQSFVLQGPPGTGKTQTIANIIAECLAAGKRVLFVSQKQAALEQVQERLERAGVGALCLEAHSHKPDKKNILEQLRQAHNARPAALAVSERTLLNRADYLRRTTVTLNEFVAELHQTREPLGLSVYEANGIVARADADGVPDVMFVFTRPEDLTHAEYAEREALAERLAAFHDVFAEVETHPWRGLRAGRFTLELQSIVRDTLNQLAALAAATPHGVAALAAACGVCVPERGFNGVDALLALAEQVLDTPRPPNAWFDCAFLNELCQTAQASKTRYHTFLDRRRALTANYKDAVFAVAHDDLAERLTTRHDALLRPALGEVWRDGDASVFQQRVAQLREAAAAIEQLRRTAASMVALCDLPPADTHAAATFARRIGECAAVDPRPHAGWFAPGALPGLLRQGRDARERHEKYLKERGELCAAYDESVLRLEVPGLITRFTSEYASFARHFKPGFYRDRKQVRLCLRPETPAGGRDLLRDLQLAQSVNTQARWIAENETLLADAFGPHYRGTETEWDALKTALTQTETLTRQFSGGQVPDALAERLIASGPDIDVVRDGTERLRGYLAQMEAYLAALGSWLNLTEPPLVGDAPLAHVALGELTAWLDRVREALADYDAARAQVVALRREARQQSPPAAAALAADLAEAKWLEGQNAAITAEGEQMTARFAHFYAGLDTDWNAVLHALTWTQRARAAFPGGVPPEPFVNIVCHGDATLLAAVAVRKEALAARRAQSRPLLQELGGLFFPEHLPPADAPFAALTEWLQKRLARIGDMERWIRFQDLRNTCEAAGLYSFFEAITHRCLPAPQVVPVFRKRFHRLWLDAITDAAPALRQFRGDEHDQHVETFRTLDRQQIASAPAGVLAEAARRRRNPVLDIGEAGALRRHFGRKRPAATRKLLSEIPNLLFDLKPCLMMSPLSVSLLLDADAIWFDLVIFDEASQVFTEDAIGAILRAKQVIVAGDTQQLPPTNFFQALQDDGADEDEDAASLSEFDSILSAADAIATAPEHFAEHWLTWHYRSRYESLIAFSRRHFYNHPPLNTFPAAVRPPRVEFIHAANGVYHGGDKQPRNNPVEAARVVDLVIAQRERDPTQSVGVITFNEAQQKTVQTEMERRVRERPDLAALLSDDETESLFVKNIETVQGDERDVIFLSVGYARNPDGKLSMNFGPLNKDGGERRLNVAVSRARERMVVVSSLLPTDAGWSDTLRRGPALLRTFLDYAQTSRLDADPSQDTPPQTPFEDAVEAALRGRGHSIHRRVGLFHYRVDLAIVHPDDPGRYLLGIECDGEVYKSGETARARDRLRGEVLGAMGWRLHRVWSCDWVRDPAGELRRLEQAIERAKRGEAAPRATQPPVPPPPAEIVTASAPEPPPISSPAAARRDLPPGITYFKQAQITLKGGRDTLESEAVPQREARLRALQQLVETEGPLPTSVAAQRLVKAAGLGRTGAVLQKAADATIERLIKRGNIERRGEFLWPTGMSTPPARVPKPGDEPRLIENISLEEVVEIMVALLKDAIGVRQDEAVDATARLMGYQQTGVNVRRRIEEAIAVLEMDTRADVRGFRIRALEL